MGVEMTASAKNDTPIKPSWLKELLVLRGRKYRLASGQKLWLSYVEELETALTAARAEAEAWKIYAGHQEKCAWCADSIDDCDEGQTLRDAAIDAARSTEGK
jgi:hypothetical protein